MKLIETLALKVIKTKESKLFHTKLGYNFIGVVFVVIQKWSFTSVICDSA